MTLDETDTHTGTFRMSSLSLSKRRTESVGLDVGLAEVGLFVGLFVGLAEVGLFVGLFVGLAEVGLFVGLLVGLFVGLAEVGLLVVGLFVGFLVEGFTVGFEVSHIDWHVSGSEAMQVALPGILVMQRKFSAHSTFEQGSMHSPRKPSLSR